MEEVAPTWNKKRVFIALFLLLLLIVGGFFLKNSVSVDTPQQAKSVKGIDTENETSESEFNIDIQGMTKEKINNLKKEVLSLDVLEIASSSPQVQKIINDIKSLEQYPVNQVKEICKKICGL